MASPLSASRIVEALRAEGCRVVEVREWRTHNRNHKGDWGPVNGVILHHTVTEGTSRTVDICYNGYSGLPGPLCHGVIAKDGTVYMVGNGRANHAGLGDDDVLRAVIAENALPDANENNTDGNSRFYGFECENLGDNRDVWPLEQVDAMVRASAAIIRAHAWGRDGDTSVIGHKEWQDGKIDPRGPIEGGGWMSMGDIRHRVAERLRHPADWDGGVMALDRDDVKKMWMTDGIIAAPVDGDNKFWMPSSFIRDNNKRIRAIQAQLEAQGSAISELAKALAAHDEQIDADALVDRIKESIEGITVRLQAEEEV